MIVKIDFFVVCHFNGVSVSVYLILLLPYDLKNFKVRKINYFWEKSTKSTIGRRL